MATASRIYDFTDGQILTGDQLDGEFNNLVNTVNNLDNDNISVGANIAPTKISASIKGDGISRSSSTGALSAKTDNVSIEVSGDNIQIKDSGVTTAKIADSNVTTAKIADSNVTTAKIADSNVTRAKLEAVGQQTANGGGTTTSSSYIDAGLSVTITTTGRPVIIFLQPNSPSSPFQVGGVSSTTTGNQTIQSYYKLLRDATSLGEWFVTLGIFGSLSISAQLETAAPLIYMDTPAAGTYTYKYQYKNTSGVGGVDTVLATAKMVAYEL